MDESNLSEFETVVLRTTRQAARRSHAAQRGFVDMEDLVQEGYAYILLNQEKVEGWLEDGSVDLLRHALYQHMHVITMRQRYLQDGTRPEDYYVYQYAVLEDLLPEALDTQPNYGTSTSDLNTQVKSGKSPAEGGDRMAMVADVKAALLSLSEKERELILRKYFGNGLTDEQLSKDLDIPESTINKQVRAAMRKMARALGSEPVRRRKAMSNAHAQHVTKEQDGE